MIQSLVCYSVQQVFMTPAIAARQMLPRSLCGLCAHVAFSLNTLRACSVSPHYAASIYHVSCMQCLCLMSWFDPLNSLWDRHEANSHGNCPAGLLPVLCKRINSSMLTSAMNAHFIPKITVLSCYSTRYFESFGAFNCITHHLYINLSILISFILSGRALLVLLLFLLVPQVKVLGGLLMLDRCEVQGMESNWVFFCRFKPPSL